MAYIQNYLNNFHDKIKLGTFDENQTLCQKRDIVFNKIKAGLKEKFKEMEISCSSISYINQGSYKLGTGINPPNKDYDIDVGILIDLHKEDFPDPIQIKELIFEIIKNHTTVPPKIKRPCLTITYSLSGEPTFHVDLPVYFKSKYNDSLYLSWGKPSTSDEEKTWLECDPRGLSDTILNNFSGDDRAQFRRIVRYLKVWKDIKFSQTGNAEPPSIGLTLDVLYSFSPITKYNQIKDKTEYDDLNALIQVVNGIKNMFIYDFTSETYSISRLLPVKPGKNVYEKMTLKQMTYFYESITKLSSALESVLNEADTHKACKIMSQYFGPNFEVPEPQEVRVKTSKSHANSSSSAVMISND